MLTKDISLPPSMASLPIRTALDGPTKPETVPGPPCFIGGVPLRLLLWGWGNGGRVASSSALLLIWGYSPVVAKCFPWFCQALRHHTLRKGQVSLSFLHSKTQLISQGATAAARGQSALCCWCAHFWQAQLTNAKGPGVAGAHALKGFSR